MGPVMAALTIPASPAPEGPGWVLRLDNCDKTSRGNPVYQLTMGYRLHPWVIRFGPLDHAWSKGRSQPPLKAIRWRTSKSDDPRKAFRSKTGICERRLRNPEELSMEGDEV